MATTYKQYLLLLMLTTFSLLGIVSLINYEIDPASIYQDLDEGNTNLENVFASKLLRSSNGLLWPNNSWDERDIKSSLAKNNNINTKCAVIGSSHVMQISSFRNYASLKRVCPSIMNLGVSGGTLEDYLALSYILANKNNKPKTIVFGIAPWALDLDRDSRWERYKKSYYLMKEQLESNISSGNDYNSKIKYIVNLINPQYFYRSLQTIGKTKTKFEIVEAPKFNLSHGIKEPVILPDGSHVYSKKYISDSDSSIIPIGGSNYKIKVGSQSSDASILLFKNLVHFLHSVDINVVILMTPYHHNVWENKNSVTTQALLEVEALIWQLGKELNVDILGSYNPYKIGCDADEFYDFMHAKDKCLSKIDN